ncbi:MAG TPA: peptide ABC transporter substrate-binding protein [Patescibacteria group bacterium]|nr:peptide ABC transporter substrate-binding protein [Patescibacteria group bacterium]
MDTKRAFKLRFRRQLRLQRKQVEELSANAEERIENDFFKRLERLGAVKRFVISWLLLLVLLIGLVIAQTRALSGYYQKLVPVPGGTYTEGILGSFTNANPIYASDLVDASVSKLLFAGLLTYDANNQLAGDLASDWAVDATGTVYTVHLKPHLTWQDGQPLTSADVAFTYHVIQSPDANSPLYSSWQGITVAAPDPHTVTFTLPNPLASFVYSLTNGIVPEHVLGDVSMSDMRSASFDTTKPVGAGPFQWQAIQLTGSSDTDREEHIALKPFDNYHGGRPKFNSFVIRTFRAQDQLIKAFKAQEVSAMVGLTSVPSGLKGASDVTINSLPLTAAVMTFFRTTQGVLADAKVRQALVEGSNQTNIIDSLGYATRAVREPLLNGQLAYNPAYQQSGFNPLAANALLDADGWVRAKDGYRHKNGAALTFQLEAENSGEYPQVARELALQWKALGVDARVNVQDNVTFQNALSYHTYDAILYGISIGVDPDVYVYWDSTQADIRAPVRLNLSEYNSATADSALEAGRTRLDPVLRAIKYAPFLQAWQTDAPALGMYQPRFLYITHGQVYGLGQGAINTDTDRFSNVQNWETREARKTIN